MVVAFLKKLITDGMDKIFFNLLFNLKSGERYINLFKTVGKH